MMRSVATLLLTSLLCACGPIAQFPGVRIGGAETPAPSNFDFVSEVPEIQLAAQGDVLTRVVNIWGVSLEGDLYVWGAPDSGWVTRTAERPDVRVRIGDQTYPLRAERVEDVEERQRVRDAYADKYGDDLTAIFGRPATVDDFALVYRLSPR